MIHQILNLTRPLFVLDTETTGVDPQKDRIVEIGFQQWGAEGMTKEWRSLVNPGIPIPASATRVHGITDRKVQECQDCGRLREEHGVAIGAHCKFAPTFRQLAPNLAKGLAACDFAGKNVRFDLRITAAEMARAGQPWSYAGARIVDADRLEQLAVPRDLGSMHEKYVRTPCEVCHGRGHQLTDEQVKWRITSAELTDDEKCRVCDGLGHVGHKHDGAHGALSDARASATVIAKQLETFPMLPRDLNKLHELSWPGWLCDGGEFRTVDGVATCMFGKWRGRAMRDIPIDYFDWLLRSDFPADVKALAAEAKLGRFPDGSS